MAGDVDLPEALLAPVQRGHVAMAAAPPVLHDYGPAVRIGMSAAPGPQAPLNDADLTEQEKLGLKAFRLRLNHAYRQEKESRPHKSASWSGADEQPRLHRDHEAVIPPTTGDPDAVAEAPQARRLAGRIAVGLVIVSGPGSLAMSEAQQQKIVAEVQNGLSFLGGQAPARDVTFVYDIQLA